MRMWPRCSALPVADAAEQKRVPWSAESEPATPGEDFAGNHKRRNWEAMGAPPVAG